MNHYRRLLSQKLLQNNIQVMNQLIRHASFRKFQEVYQQKLKSAQCKNGYASLEASAFIPLVQFYDILAGNEKGLQ
jgi:hypothetical protein